MSRQASEGSTDLIRPADAVIRHIHNNKTLFKIIKPEHWDDFLRQISDSSYRPKLRAINKAGTHKLVHLTQEIVTYGNPKRGKVYTHTKKQSATFLSKNLNTIVFG